MKMINDILIYNYSSIVTFLSNPIRDIILPVSCNMGALNDYIEKSK
jgi:hypothetical protein